MNRGRFFILILFLSAVLPVWAGAKVVINEVAWMGTQTSATDEWIELYSDLNWNLQGWTLVTADGGMKINLKSSSSTANYYLIERTDDSAVPDVKADLAVPFGKGLSNDGEILILKDADGNIVDQVDGSNGWPIGGEVANKNTLQRARNRSDATVGVNWITAVATPKAENAEYVKKVIQPSSKSPGKKSDFQGKTDFKDGDFEKDGAGNEFSASAVDSGAPSLNSEYLWLLGGILGGAVLGLVLIMTKRFRP
ncbi:MAG: lamin tail domain-containing protein [bacterium]|nr:lamin tail domain-containing protein [bacterium]